MCTCICACFVGSGSLTIINISIVCNTCQKLNTREKMGKEHEMAARFIIISINAARVIGNNDITCCFIAGEHSSCTCKCLHG